MATLLFTWVFCDGSSELTSESKANSSGAWTGVYLVETCSCSSPGFVWRPYLRLSMRKRTVSSVLRGDVHDRIFAVSD